jgi:hypothetical protein
MPLAQFDETLPSFEGKSGDGNAGASQDGTFHTPTARLPHGIVCYRCEAKIPNTTQNQATRRYKNFMEKMLFTTRELQQGIARCTKICCGIYGKNTTIAGTPTG